MARRAGPDSLRLGRSGGLAIGRGLVWLEPGWPAAGVGRSFGADHKEAAGQ